MSADLRLLQALRAVEATLEMVPMRPSFAVARAAAAHGVDRLALACALLDKLIARDRARARIVAMEEGDNVEQPPARNPRPRKP